MSDPFMSEDEVRDYLQKRRLRRLQQEQLANIHDKCRPGHKRWQIVDAVIVAIVVVAVVFAVGHEIWEEFKPL